MTGPTVTVHNGDPWRKRHCEGCMTAVEYIGTFGHQQGTQTCDAYPDETIKVALCAEHGMQVRIAGQLHADTGDHPNPHECLWQLRAIESV